jgi:protein-ribulosamine 3-kinase
VLADSLQRATGRTFARSPAVEVAGGSIHRCVRWETDTGPVFVKIAAGARTSAFEAEADGLRALSAASALRVPEVLAIASAGDEIALVLDWIEAGPASTRSEERLGRQLAEMHRCTGAQFGWHRDNTIGRTPQPNEFSDDWARFYADRRLGFQLQLAGRNGLDTRAIERGHRLVESCASFFSGHRPAPSLLHGDLWGGNWATVAGSDEPVIFDPAVYYGDCEADLAMTRLFGGFGPAFYRAYAEAWPLATGAETRCTLYNLYHVLNHYNLFGGGYGRQAAAMIEQLLAET